MAPLKTITIPCLELSATAISVKQDKVLRRELEIPIDEQSVFLTDSTAVLCYVKNKTRRYHTFVANRVAVIRDGSEPHQWNYVCGDMNPADDASQGLTADTFLCKECWLMGPEFLWKPQHMWPLQTETLSEISDEDPEVKTEVKVCVSSLNKQSSSLSDYFVKCSSWLRLKKIVAWLLRYRENLLDSRKSNKPDREVPKNITLEEMGRAEKEILKHVQRKAFSEELSHPEKPVKKSSRLYKLNPLIVDDL